jgi:hypothetical protein
LPTATSSYRNGGSEPGRDRAGKQRTGRGRGEEMRQAEQWASGSRVGFLRPGEREREKKKMAMVLMSCERERESRGSWSGKKL